MWASVKAVYQAPIGSVVVLHTDNIAVYHAICLMAYLTTDDQQNVFAENKI